MDDDDNKEVGACVKYVKGCCDVVFAAVAHRVGEMLPLRVVQLGRWGGTS